MNYGAIIGTLCIIGRSGRGTLGKSLPYASSTFQFSRSSGALSAFLAWVIALCAAACAWAGEAGDLDALFNRLDQVNAEVESTLLQVQRSNGLAPPATQAECYNRILSGKKNAVVSIGGEMRATYSYVRSDWVDKSHAYPFLQTDALGKSRLGDLSLTRERLYFDLGLGDRWRAFLEINLSENSGPYTVWETRNPNRGLANPTADYPSRRRGDFLGEAYIELLKAGHSGFGFKVGRMVLPFGVAAKPDLFTQSFLAAPDLTGSYLMAPLNRDASPRLPHASAMLDPVLAAMISYEMRDIIRFEGALFQESRDWHESYLDEYFNNYVSRNPGYGSFQVGASILPLEGWELSVAFRNRYDKGRGVSYWADSPFRGDFRRNLATGLRDPIWNNGQWADYGDGPSFGSVKNEQAFVAGLAMEIPNTKLSFFAEYAHGWNQGFNSHIRSDDVNIGLAYRLTPRLTLHGQAEWLFVKDGSWILSDGMGGWYRDVQSNRIGRTMLGFEYELMAGLVLEGGWQYENWLFKSAIGGAKQNALSRTLASSMFYAGSKFSF